MSDGEAYTTEAPFEVELLDKIVSYKDRALRAIVKEGHLLIARGGTKQTVAIYAPGRWYAVNQDTIREA